MWKGYNHSNHSRGDAYGASSPSSSMFNSKRAIGPEIAGMRGKKQVVPPLVEFSSSADFWTV